MRNITLSIAAALLVVFAWPTISRAGFIGNLLTIEAAADGDVDTLEIALPPGKGKLHWKIEKKHEFRGKGQGKHLGFLDDMEVDLDGDPAVNLAFVATAGNSGTTFTITSAVVSFPALVNPFAVASAEVTLTDSSTDGAALTPISPRVGMFVALYNFGATDFAQLLGPQSLSSGGTLTASEGTGIQTIAGSVSDIQALFRFYLSANDSVTGHGHFEVAIPEPVSGGLLLIGVAGLLLRRRPA